MTSQTDDPDYGIPEPITKLTYEQDLRMRLLEDKLNETYYEHKEDVITLFLALQRQAFILGNSLTNLVNKWPKVQPTINEDLSMFGILLETKD